MPLHHRPHLSILILLISGLALAAAAPQRAALASPPGPTALQSTFDAAAQEFHVPESVLLAVSYNVSRWETHGGAPSTSGGYGPMHLTDVDTAEADLRGDGADRSEADTAALHTLARAAALLGSDPAALRSDPAQNIRGGAALLAQYARDTTGALPSDPADWYGAVAKYSGWSSAAQASDFADRVYATISKGQARRTADSQQITLAAQPILPNKQTASALGLIAPSASSADCPSALNCDFIPAAYQMNSGDSDYGNYDLADRPNHDLPIRYIVIHDTETSYTNTLQTFQNPLDYASTHYVIRSTDGHIAQMIENRNVAWHAGNWYINSYAIGIEHEGVAIEGASWYSEQLYSASAALTRHLADEYDIPLDRAHIIGHDEVPGPLPTNQAGMHWDPGPFWDWAHYMDLVGAPIASSSFSSTQTALTISPDFASNTPAMTYCYGDAGDDCRDVESQPANFAYLYSQPSFASSLITNTYITAEPTRANNWANKAMTGQQFYRLARQGDWDEIYFSGQAAWLYNPGQTIATPTLSATLITPKSGLSSIAVYGRAYPEAAAYPSDISAQALTPIYTMPAGQIYVASDRVTSGYFYAPTYIDTFDASKHFVVSGTSTYYQIFFNHRFAFVNASDVDLVALKRPIYLPIVRR